MKILFVLLSALILCPIMGHEAFAGPGLCRANASDPTWNEGKDVPCSTTLNGDIRVVPNAQAGDDIPNNVKIVEGRYSTLPQGASTAMFSADQLVKSGTGYIEGFVCYSDATATAGTIDIRDGIVAATGNVLYSFSVLAVAYNTPFNVDLHTTFAVGLYFDFTTTTDMSCMARYR